MPLRAPRRTPSLPGRGRCRKARLGRSSGRVPARGSASSGSALVPQTSLGRVATPPAALGGEWPGDRDRGPDSRHERTSQARVADERNRSPLSSASPSASSVASDRQAQVVERLGVSFSAAPARKPSARWKLRVARVGAPRPAARRHRLDRSLPPAPMRPGASASAQRQHDRLAPSEATARAARYAARLSARRPARLQDRRQIQPVHRALGDDAQPLGVGQPHRPQAERSTIPDEQREG